MKEEYLPYWKKNRKKINWNSWKCLHSLLKVRGRSWGSKEGHRVQSRVCVQTTFSCRLANVSVTVLSAVLLHFINVSSGEQLDEEQFSTSANSNALAAAVSGKGTAASMQVLYGHQLLRWHPVSSCGTSGWEYGAGAHQSDVLWGFLNRA